MVAISTMPESSFLCFLRFQGTERVVVLGNEWELPSAKNAISLVAAHTSASFYVRPKADELDPAGQWKEAR